MYYKEKFEDGKWWIQSIPNGKWYEMSLEGYKAKAIDLSTKAVKENDFIDGVSVLLPTKEAIKDKYELVDSWGNTGHPDECYQQGVEDMYEAIEKELNER